MSAFSFFFHFVIDDRHRTNSTYVTIFKNAVPTYIDAFVVSFGCVGIQFIQYYTVLTIDNRKRDW